MKKICDYKKMNANNNTVLVIGNFDGVHLGHQKIIKNAKKFALEKNLPLSILMFDPIPKEYFNKNKDKISIYNSDDKADFMKKLGVDFFINTSFAKIMHMSDKEFVEKVIIKYLKAVYVFVGYDFMFGKNRQGCIKTLRKHSEFKTIVIDKQINKKFETFSSTKIREYIKNGNIKEANDMLGHSFFVSGKIIEGNKIGKTINFPTVNLKINNTIKPKYGVYASTLSFEEKKYKAISNFGIRPTVNDKKEEVFETHIFNFKENIYNKFVKIHLQQFIREEKKFTNFDDLKKQIKKDCDIVKKM